MAHNIARAIDHSATAASPNRVSVGHKRRRGVRAEPQLSIVLVAMEETVVSESLRSTLSACDAAGVELVLVQRGQRTSGSFFRRLRNMRTLTASSSATAAELRAAGMATANGDIVTVCELPARGDEPGFTWPLSLAAARQSSS